jgi:tripartite ATP-independent transporter DctP family solute receptor
MQIRSLVSQMLAMGFMSAVLIAAPITAEAADKIIIKAALIASPDGAQTIGFNKLKESLEKATNGAVEFQIYTDGQLGNEREIIEGVSLGTIEVGIVSTGPVINFIPEYRMMDFPYMFPSLDVARTVFEGPVGQKLLAKFDAIGIHGAGFWDCGYRYMTSNKPIVHPSDVKGLKLRTMENDMHMALFRMLGATPTPMAIGEFLTAVRQGTVDGHENVLFSIYTKKIHETNRFIGKTRHLYGPSPFMVNKAFYDSLPNDIRTAFDKAESEARAWMWETGKNLDDQILEDMKKEGVTITEVDFNEWREATKGVYTEFKNFVNPEIMEAIAQAEAKTK